MTINAGCSSTPQNKQVTQSPQYDSTNGTFRNSVTTALSDSSSFFSMLKRYFTEKKINSIPDGEIPVHPLTRQQLDQALTAETAVYRLGHSSLLLTLNKKYWLIDPVFSDRASPFSFAGPKRFHPTPIDLAALPDIEGVIISHDHYDHLDKNTVKVLADSVNHFLVPLGVGRHLSDWGIEPHKVKELDWWEGVSINDVTFTATPARHFSGRSLTDRNSTLWASWAIEASDMKIFYSGDTGYFDGFKAIGKKFGGFDLAIMENGAYDRDWSQIHMQPDETMLAFLDLQAEAMLPVHNSTFDLAFHPWIEPLERITALAKEQNALLVTPEIGQRLTRDNLSDHQSRWWRSVSSEALALTNKPLLPSDVVDSQG